MSEVGNKKLIPAKRWHQHHSIPTQGAVNSMILRRHENGLAKHVVRLNNRLYLIEEEFQDWILSHREGAQLQMQPRGGL